MKNRSNHLMLLELDDRAADKALLALQQGGRCDILVRATATVKRVPVVEHDPRVADQAAILEFAARRVPADWRRWDVARRREFWADRGDDAGLELVERDRICAAEIWCELFGNDVSAMSKADAHEINAVLERRKGWRASVLRCGPYSTQRGYVRDDEGRNDWGK